MTALRHEHHLRHQVNDTVGAFTELFELDPGTPSTGPLAGLTFAVKELFDVAGTLTTASTEVAFTDIPAAHDAPAVARLRQAGARLVGRARSHEFAWGITTRHPRRGGTVNPHDRTRTAGGSSGGSAAAVAAGLVDFALGTDTGGSTRIPAAFCGVVGYKPAYGRIPLDGVVPLAPTLDHVGVLAHTVAEAVRVADIAAGAIPGPLPTVEPTDVRIGLAAPLGDLALPDVADVHQTIQRTEALAVHRAMGTWPAQAERYGDDVRARFEAAEAVTGAEAAAAYRQRDRLVAEWTERLAGYDAVLLPTAPCGPSTVDDPDHVVRNGRRVPLRDVVMPFTFFANVVGFPAFSVPIGTDEDGMPVGLQLLAVPARERRLAAVAAAMANRPRAPGRRGTGPSP